MKLRNLLVGAAAASLTIAPVAAQAAQADMARTAAPISSESELAGGFGPAVIIILLAAAGMAALLLSDDDDQPVSA